MAELSPDLIIVLDPDGTILFTSENVEEYSGYTKSEIIGKNGFEFVHRQDIRKAVETISTATKNINSIARSQFRLRHKSGKFILLESSIRSFINGKKTYLITFNRELSLRNRTESLIKDLETKYTTIFKTAGLWICLTSVEGYILETNPYVTKILGYNEKEIINKSFKEITHPEDIKKGVRVLEQMTSGKITRANIIKRYIHKDGHVVWAELVVTMIRNRKGQPLYLIGLIEDITSKVENDNLRKKFISVISHELKTPLTVVDLDIQLLIKACQENPLVGQYLPRLKTIKAELTRFANTIDELTSMVSATDKKIVLNSKSFDLGFLISEIVDEFKLINFQNTFEYVPIQANVIADRDKIKQVLINLISNAIKYSPISEKIHISLIKKNGFFITSIKDKGTGIDSGKIKNIFKLFFQEDITSHGFGFGLYLSKLIVENHKGKIWVESKKGEGSTFSISLPA